MFELHWFFAKSNGYFGKIIWVFIDVPYLKGVGHLSERVNTDQPTTNDTWYNVLKYSLLQFSVFTLQMARTSCRDTSLRSE